MTQIGPYEVLYAYQGEGDTVFLQTADCAYGITPAHPLWLAYEEADIETLPSKPATPADAIAAALEAIHAIEAEITPRRIREAILGTDDGWLSQKEAEIEAQREIVRG